VILHSQEIALLKKIPRTATVRCTRGPGLLLSIGRTNYDALQERFGFRWEAEFEKRVTAATAQSLIRFDVRVLGVQVVPGASIQCRKSLLVRSSSLSICGIALFLLYDVLCPVFFYCFVFALDFSLTGIDSIFRTRGGRLL